MRDYKVLQEKRKTLSIHVLPDSKIVVKAPNKATSSEIENFVKRKQSWIEKQLSYFKEFGAKKTDNNLVSGSEIFYLGKQYRLLVKKSLSLKEYVKVEKYDLVIYSLLPNNQNRNKIIFDNWLNKKQEKQFKQIFDKAFARFQNIPKPELKIRKLSRRWGSFLEKGVVILNPSLIITSKKCIEYVITHELCHHYHKNHSSAFYSLLGAKLPDWDKTKAKLELYSKYV